MVVVAATAVAVGGCEEVEQFLDTRRPATPHEAYQFSLEDAGLANTALTREWLAEAEEALRDPRPVDLPFREEGFIPPEDPTAVGYRFTLERGQLVTVALEVESDEETRVFLDLMRIADDPADPPRPLSGVDTTDAGWQYEPYRAGEFVLRVQPELLRGGRYTLTVSLDPALAFPVEGGDTRDIGSVFGDARDAGRRSHHGVDIFAPRGTPVLASSAGRVNRVNVTNLGGKVVWLRDERRNRNLYYAHLDSQFVTRGQEVEVGDTLGFVGNTGNARTTPPHLHYGIYARGEGPIDPFPFLRRPPGTMPDLPSDPAILGLRVRSSDAGLRVRSGPTSSSEVVAELVRHAPLRVLGGTGDWWRVRLPDGRDGYVAAHLTESAESAVSELVAMSDRPATASPLPNAPIVEILRAGTTVPVLGSFEGYLLVRGPSGRDAWVAQSED